ncbi:hypothetical protein AB0C13_20170 [Streptomyces sp. NPDC049099]|uniref:hypothetical protein n=1 Tax=Streptomyces sp. NPDC049099 TaxID=3155768 RepID=UPI00342107CC
MTALRGDGTQWADFGVNVGGDVHGTINIYPATSTGTAAQSRDERARSVSATRHASVRSALAALARACARAMAALSAAGPPRPDRRSDDID